MKLKAYYVWSGDEWGAWVAAATPGQARSLMTGFYTNQDEFTDYRPVRSPHLDDIAAAQPKPMVMECEEFGPIFRNRGVCCQECIDMGCGYGKAETEGAL